MLMARLAQGSDTVNVVRFPGDWFGPLEDLVPIGVAAEPGNAERDVAGRDVAGRDVPGPEAGEPGIGTHSAAGQRHSFSVHR